MAFGLWALVDGEVGLGLSVVAAMTLGIVVDDTIHFLARYRLEVSRNDNIEDALKNTYHYAGRGIVMTTLILTIGFCPFIFCQYFSLQILGTLLPLVLVVALLADLLLLPALARLRLLRF